MINLATVDRLIGRTFSFSFSLTFWSTKHISVETQVSVQGPLISKGHDQCHTIKHSILTKLNWTDMQSLWYNIWGYKRYVQEKDKASDIEQQLPFGDRK